MIMDDRASGVETRTWCHSVGGAFLNACTQLWPMALRSGAQANTVMTVPPDGIGDGGWGRLNSVPSTAAVTHGRTATSAHHRACTQDAGSSKAPCISLAVQMGPGCRLGWTLERLSLPGIYWELTRAAPPDASGTFDSVARACWVAAIITASPVIMLRTNT
ncbi:hypothetical protein C8Q74DRAFT_1220996 [Fomes fomentarius]|nr:hypothetical protein C8Q74DRAFT_1220996 [Fomes fomentarius]